MIIYLLYKLFSVILFFLDKLLNESLACIDGFQKLPFKWSSDNKKKLNIPKYGIDINKLDYCLDINNDDIVVYICSSKLKDIMEDIIINEMLECERKICLRKCGNFDTQKMIVTLHKYDFENEFIKTVLSHESGKNSILLI